MAERNGKVRTISLSLCLMMVLAAGTGAWAISTEVHNYRLSNHASRLDSHDDIIRVHDRAITKNTAEFAYIISSLDRLIRKHEDGGS